MNNELNKHAEQSDKLHRIVYSRANTSWYLIGTYLDIMRSLGNVVCDEQFNKLFAELRDYVDKQFVGQCEGEISDMFVIVEQTVAVDANNS